MKIYISGAITGTSDYMERFAEAEKRVRETYYKCNSIINPARVNAQLPQDTNHEQYMMMSFTMLDMCDTIYLMKGWKDSKGACMEYGYALGKGMTIIMEGD